MPKASCTERGLQKLIARKRSSTEANYIWRGQEKKLIVCKGATAETNCIEKFQHRKDLCMKGPAQKLNAHGRANTEANCK